MCACVFKYSPLEEPSTSRLRNVYALYTEYSSAAKSRKPFDWFRGPPGAENLFAKIVLRLVLHDDLS